MSTRSEAFTKLHIVVDTHITPKTSEEEDRVAGILRQIIADINTKQGYIDLLVPHLKRGTKLVKAQMLSFSIEKGDARNSLHFHAVVSITHTGQFLLTSELDGVNITGRFIQWITDRLPWLKPNSAYYREFTTPYVRVHLADSTAENYAAKDGHS
jgi:hypothetical protein